MQKENVTITIEKIIKVPVHEVWRAWTDPSVVMQWFGSDPNGKVKNARLDVRQGGSFEVTFQDGDLTEHTCYGTYIEVKEDSALTFSWTWKSEPGVTSFIDLNLTSIDQQTSMHFKHSGVGTASAHNYEKGWADTFLKLERVLGKQVL